MATTAVKSYSFVLVLAGVTELTVELSDLIYGSGIDDALVHSAGPIVMVDFDREEESLGHAVGSAIRSVEKAGLKVARIIVDETGQETAAE